MLGWIGCEEPPEGSPQDGEPFTAYGIRKEVQERLLADPARCRRLGEAAAREARERFTWERHKREVEEVYRDLLGG